LRILCGLWHANGYAGTQSWNYTVAREFKKMGHDVSFYTGGRGTFAARCENEGFHVYTHFMNDKPEADVAFISQPRTFQVCRVCGAGPIMDVGAESIPSHPHRWKGSKCVGSNTPPRNVLPDCKRVYVMHGWLPHDAPLLDGSAYVTVSRETHDRLLKKYKIESIRVEQPIDLARFVETTPLREKPKAVSMATFAADPGVVQRACDEAGVDLLERIGQTWNTPAMLNGADILIGTGRGVAEAMSCGRAAVVCGQHGCDGMVTADNWEDLLEVNLSGRHTRNDPAEVLAAELANYNPSVGLWARTAAVETFDPRVVAEKMLEAA